MKEDTISKNGNRKSKIENRKSIVLVMAGILAGNVTGFLREAVIAQRFGLSRWTDAYLIAFTLPEFVFTLLTVVVGGAVIPVFLTRQLKEGESSAWSLWGAFTLALGVALTLGAAVGIVTAPIYLRWMAPGFSQAELPIIVKLARPMLLAVVLIGLSVSVSAVLNACRRFTLPSLATAAYNLTFVAAVIGVGAWLGPAVLGWAVLLGAAAHLGLQVPALRRQVAGPIRIRTGYRDLQGIARLALPLAAGYTIHHAAIAVDRALASGLSTGSVGC